MTTPTNASHQGLTRGYTVGDDWYPGVTSLIRATIAEPIHLGRWKQKRLIAATLEALNITHIDAFDASSIDVDEITQRAMQAARETSPEAELGTRVHAAIEAFEAGSEMSIDDPEILKYLAQWQRLKEEHAIDVQASEITLVNTTLKYAGTADALVTVDLAAYRRDLHVLDLKTGKGVYDTYALQLALLSRCDAQLTDDGELVPLASKPNGDWATIAKIGPRSAHLYPVNIHVAWKYARHLVDLWVWQQGAGDACIGDKVPGASEKARRLALDERRLALLERARALDVSAKAIVKASWDDRWPRLIDSSLEWTDALLDDVDELIANAERGAVA